ncbi:MAG: formate C-acetyltransferase [Sporolactobacillus sp.]
MLESQATAETYWRGFNEGVWQEEIDIRDFIFCNYQPHDGDESFLCGPTEATVELNDRLLKMKLSEREAGGVLDADVDVVSTITSHAPGYLDRRLEKIVGLQTDKPLKKALMPFGGIRMAKEALASHGLSIDADVEHLFNAYRKTHNQGVFDAYDAEMRRCRHNHIITGLPDSYGRGRLIGDFPRIALYGVDRLMKEKARDFEHCGDGQMTEAVIRLREEISEQYRALTQMKQMASSYGFDISRPAGDAREAVQWLYFGYLAAIKQQNGAAMSIGRIDAFLDIYIERDLREGTLTERAAQELIDHLTMKLRMVSFIRTPEYDALFSGNPIWATLSLAGMTLDGRHMVTKTSYRFLRTLANMGPSPEPNITLLWSGRLPDAFKRYAASVSVDSSTIQYENDELMRTAWGTDYYAIACCVSAQPVASGMQFFGARANLAKAILYTINGGVDELTKQQVAPAYEPISGDVIDYDAFMQKFRHMLDWLAGVYVNSLNVIHYMHDKYYYESAQMALKNTVLDRTFATGISGLAVAVDSIAAIKYGRVHIIRDDTGLAVDYHAACDFPKYGNNDERADHIAGWLVKQFYTSMNRHALYRGAKLSTSVLTITSNVVYGNYTGATPNGRRAKEPFSPGANPFYGAETNGALASLLSVAKLPYRYATDGISNTFAVTPAALGDNPAARAGTLVRLVDGYMNRGGHHLNANIFNCETLRDAQKHPENYPTLTIRVSGYCVYFADLTKKQQDDVIARTFHERM